MVDVPIILNETPCLARLTAIASPLGPAIDLLVLRTVVADCTLITSTNEDVDLF
jgi:hypothetical protein